MTCSIDWLTNLTCTGVIALRPPGDLFEQSGLGRAVLGLVSVWAYRRQHDAFGWGPVVAVAVGSKLGPVFLCGDDSSSAGAVQAQGDEPVQADGGGAVMQPVIVLVTPR